LIYVQTIKTYKYKMTQKIITGKEFNEQYKNYEFYKLLNENLIHFGYKYVDGLNIDINKFNPTNECMKGGLYFTEKR